MFSLKTIQKKIEKLSNTPTAKSDNRANRKRKNGKTDPNVSNTKKQRQDTMNAEPANTASTTTPTMTGLNKNKVPPPHHHTNTNTTAERGRKKKRKKKKTNNRSKSEGDTDHTDDQKKSLPAASSLPVLYADSGPSNRRWQDLWHDSDSEGFVTSPVEDRGSSSRLGKQNEHCSNDYNQPWGGGKKQFQASYQHTKEAVRQSSDLETSRSSRNPHQRTFGCDPNEAMKGSSDSEHPWRGRTKHQHDQNWRVKNSDKEMTDPRELMEGSSSSEQSWRGRKKHHDKNWRMKGSDKETTDPKEAMEGSSDTEQSWRGRKKRHDKNWRMKNSDKETADPKELMVGSSDSGQSWRWRNKHQHDKNWRVKNSEKETTDPKELMEGSSDSERSWRGRNKHQYSKKSKVRSSFMKAANPQEVTEGSSDSEQSWRGKNKHHDKKSKAISGHMERGDLDIDRSLMGECLAVTKTERGSVVAALSQGSTLYLQGIVTVCPLLGSVEVLGYTLQQGMSQALHSLPTASLLGVSAVEAQSLDPASDSLSGVDSAWLEELKEKTSSAVILEVSRHSSPRVDFLVSAGWGVLGECRERQMPWNSIGASIVTRGNCHKNRVTHILPEWREAAQTLVETLKCGSVPCVVVGGGKGVGKSTFFKYLANTLLTATPSTGVMCLDFDPGQPELSLSTSLSLTHLTQPLLAPAYAHDLSGVSLSRTHKLVGAISPQFVLEGYVAAVRELCEAARERAGDAPVLVNTMGWTRGTGLGLMLDVLRLANPTHVIQIQGTKAKLNFPFPLEARTVVAAKGGITTQADTTELYYSLTHLSSGGQPSSAPHISQPQALRELRVLAEAGQAVEHGSRVTVPWAKVALHVCEEQVPKDRILQVLNAQMVALCCVDPASLYTIRPDLPQLLTPGAGYGDLLGWAVVMGIDPLTSNIHLATALPAEVVNGQVNALVMPQIHMPASFYKLFCIGEGPYLKKESREGAGRLRVGRRVKPRGPKK